MWTSNPLPPSGLTAVEFDIFKMGLLFESFMLDVLVALATLAYLVYAYFSHAYNYWKDRGIPYKKPTFFFGNMKEQVLVRKQFSDIHTEIYNEVSDSKIVGFYEFKTPSLMIRDPQLIQQLLLKEFSSFHDRQDQPDIESDVLSGHLFAVGGKYWRNLRQKLTPTFTSGKLKSMFDQIYRCTDNVVKDIDNQVKSKSAIEARELVQNFATDVIGSCAFGLELSRDSEEGKQFREMIKGALRLNKIEVLRLAVMNMYPKIAKWFKFKVLPEEKGDYFVNLSKETVKYRKEHNIKRKDFLQLLMDLKEQEEGGKSMYDATSDEYTEDDVAINQLDSAPQYGNSEDSAKIFTDGCIAAQSFMFLFTGSEPIAAVGSFCLYCIAAHPHVQKNLQQEVDAVLEKHDGKWSYETVRDMKYLNQVFNETVRLYPPAVFLFRSCNKPFKIPDTKCVIERGVRIVVPIYALHHDEKYFPNPEVFDPERFADGKQIPKGAYLPFGDGPRICIAMRFAHLEVKTCVAHLMSQFNVCVNKKTQEPLKFKPEAFGLDPVGGLWLNFERRVKG